MDEKNKKVTISREMALNRLTEFCEQHGSTTQGKDWAYGFAEALHAIGLIDVLELSDLLKERGAW